MKAIEKFIGNHQNPTPNNLDIDSNQVCQLDSDLVEIEKFRRKFLTEILTKTEIQKTPQTFLALKTNIDLIIKLSANELLENFLKLIKIDNIQNIKNYSFNSYVDLTFYEPLYQINLKILHEQILGYLKKFLVKKWDLDQLFLVSEVCEMLDFRFDRDILGSCLFEIGSMSTGITLDENKFGCFVEQFRGYF